MNNKLFKSFLLSFLFIMNAFSITLKAEEIGAFDLVEKKEKVVYSFTTKDKPEEIIGKLKAGKKYILREKKAKAGYKKAKDILFTVNKDGKEQIIKVVNERIEEIKKDKPETPRTNIENSTMLFSLFLFVSGVMGSLIFLKKIKEK